jgi:hypothetical protein
MLHNYNAGWWPAILISVRQKGISCRFVIRFTGLFRVLIGVVLQVLLQVGLGYRAATPE